MKQSGDFAAERTFAVIRLTQAYVSVMACTLAAAVAGGIAGATIGTFAPTFVEWLQGLPPGHVGRFEPAGFGFGLGMVAGLFFGAVVGTALVLELAFRDAWLARSWLGPRGDGNREGGEFA